MTDEIEEAVARGICKARGIDPDGSTGRRVECSLEESDLRGPGNILPSRQVKRWEQFQEHAEGAIAAHKSALAKDGMGIRPREATEEMAMALSNALREKPVNLSAIWRAGWDAHKPDG